MGAVANGINLALSPRTEQAYQQLDREFQVLQGSVVGGMEGLVSGSGDGLGIFDATGVPVGPDSFMASGGPQVPKGGRTQLTNGKGTKGKATAAPGGAAGTQARTRGVAGVALSAPCARVGLDSAPSLSLSLRGARAADRFPVLAGLC